MIAFTDVMQIMNKRHGANLMNRRSMLQFIGIISIPKIAEYIKIIGIKIETNAAALGAVSFV